MSKRAVPTWAVLAVCCVAQFMVVLDVSIVNVALPKMRADLDLSATGQQWIINAYTLTFAGFLLLGGRAADLFGRRRTFVLGLSVFTVSSLLGGLAQNGGCAHRRPRRAGRRRRHPGAGHAEPDHHHLHRTCGTSPRAGRLVGDRGERRCGRCAGGRHPDRPARLAVGAVRQRADRRRTGRGRDACR